ncbi:MAG TPA: carboxypeptidase-like regulatory domain-containing protein [Vicinamibacterales bacterium]|nr:carboxypeptidase-like regulatory domain-containing protein [Vicinamibacterales bacterium]
MATVLAVSAAYVCLGIVGHGTMRLVAGPARVDGLARRPGFGRGDVSVLTIVVALLAAACGRGPQQPTVPTTVQTGQRIVTQIRGTVADSAFRRLAGVKVEIVDGPNAGVFAISDSNGALSFAGTFAGVVTFRATKDGYLPATQALDVQSLCGPCDARIAFGMEAADTVLRIEPGDYTLTFVADDACTGIPGELRTRTYAATVTKSSGFPGGLDVRVAGMLYEHGWFVIGISGNYLATEDDSYPTIFEPLPQSTYLGIDFAIQTTLSGATGSGISIQFPGTFEYCALRSGSLDIRFCEFVPAANLVAHDRCFADHHRLVLERR